MFFKRLLTRISAVDCDLPYNWNWQRPWIEVDGFLAEHPITLMDIGARGNAPPELESLRRHVRRVGFEPDAEECRRLNETNTGKFFPELLGGSSGDQTLHIYRDPGYSSTFRLSRRYERLWSGDVAIDRDVRLQTVTIDDFLALNTELAPDLLKLDTQGSELSILHGAKNSLATVGLVEVEVEFAEIYESQPLFGDVAAYLGEQGFELLYLNRATVSRSQVYDGPSRGQLLFGDALFGKREDCVGLLTDTQRAKHAILLCQYGHRDIAWQLLQDWPAVSKLIPQLQVALTRRSGKTRRMLLMQVDKLLALTLHLRRYNQRAVDSDRAWPTR